MKKRIIFTALLLLCMTAIFIFSSQNGIQSAEISGNFTDKILTFLNPEIDSMSAAERTDYFRHAHFIIRKLAHFTIFMLLGILSLLTFDSYNFRSKRMKLLLSLLFCLIYAASDEYHQTFSSGRAGQLRDVIIDFGGSITGILLTMAGLALARKFFKTNQKGIESNG